MLYFNFNVNIQNKVDYIAASNLTLKRHNSKPTTLFCRSICPWFLIPSIPAFGPNYFKNGIFS